MATPGGFPISVLNLATLAVFGGDKPLCEGPRILPVLNIDFSLHPNYSLDYSNQMKTGRMSMVQTVYVDNSVNDKPLTLTFTTGQVITVKEGTQGFYNALAQDPFRVSFASAGAGKASAIFLNFQVEPAQWLSQ